eukprot:m.355953 g.355953  ORF g.355953 m.355953 type:complete len:671 (-) comp20741_c0_seq4:1929-3941(-)
MSLPPRVSCGVKRVASCSCSDRAWCNAATSLSCVRCRCSSSARKASFSWVARKSSSSRLCMSRRRASLSLTSASIIAIDCSSLLRCRASNVATVESKWSLRSCCRFCFRVASVILNVRISSSMAARCSPISRVCVRAISAAFVCTAASTCRDMDCCTRCSLLSYSSCTSSRICFCSNFQSRPTSMCRLLISSLHALRCPHNSLAQARRMSTDTNGACTASLEGSARVEKSGVRRPRHLTSTWSAPMACDGDDTDVSSGALARGSSAAFMSLSSLRKTSRREVEACLLCAARVCSSPVALCNATSSRRFSSVNRPICSRRSAKSLFRCSSMRSRRPSSSVVFSTRKSAVSFSKSLARSSLNRRSRSESSATCALRLAVSSTSCWSLRARSVSVAWSLSARYSACSFSRACVLSIRRRSRSSTSAALVARSSSMSLSCCCFMRSRWVSNARVLCPSHAFSGTYCPRATCSTDLPFRDTTMQNSHGNMAHTNFSFCTMYPIVSTFPMCSIQGHLRDIRTLLHTGHILSQKKSVIQDSSRFQLQHLEVDIIHWVVRTLLCATPRWPARFWRPHHDAFAADLPELLPISVAARPHRLRAAVSYAVAGRPTPRSLSCGAVYSQSPSWPPHRVAAAAVLLVPASTCASTRADPPRAAQSPSSAWPPTLSSCPASLLS